MQIDHDPEEPNIDRGPGPWKIAVPVVVLMWALNLYSRPIDWVSVGLGLVTGIVFIAWMIDITGNKIPDSWRSKPPRAGGS